MIKLDNTPHSTVVSCTRCPNWRELTAGGAAGKVRGWALGVAHQASVHPGADQAAAALRKYQGGPALA